MHVRIAAVSLLIWRLKKTITYDCVRDPTNSTQGTSSGLACPTTHVRLLFKTMWHLLATTSTKSPLIAEFHRHLDMPRLKAPCRADLQSLYVILERHAHHCLCVTHACMYTCTEHRRLFTCISAVKLSSRP
jgi:hypothetical protein